MKIAAIILAAGHGTRMNSVLPKVLHSIAKRPLLQYVITAATSLKPSQIIVVCGYQADQVQQAFAGLSVDWARQAKQLGTADAVGAALPYLQQVDKVLVLCGDVPLIKPETLQRLLNNTPHDALGLLTVTTSTPTGLGRIVRDGANRVIKIVEEKDATVAERAITEINPGIYLIPSDKLSPWLAQISASNAQKEFYLTDIIALAVKDGVEVHAEAVLQPEEVLGVNTRTQLAELERYYQRQQAEQLMQQGVTVLDPARIDIRGEVIIAADVTIDVNVILEGKVTIAQNVIIGPNVVIKDSFIGAGSVILSNSVIEAATIGQNCQVGPFARVRPGTVLKDNVQIGNFVEIKNSIIAERSKVNHLSYIGDTDIGTKVNIGAGVITCNYDGAKKHRTIIEDNVFIGSDTQLIAPVTVGGGATIAAGTTIMQDVPNGALALNPKQQRHVAKWQRPKKDKDYPLLD